MLIIIDKRIPGEAKTTLAGYGELMEFAAPGITYDAISGHPDIFFCLTPRGLVVAPNTTAAFLRQLDSKNIPYLSGEKPVGQKYPETARYNAVVTNNYLMHHASVTDSRLRELLLNPGGSGEALLPLNFRQAYSRCNLIALSDQHFITSDRGIEKALKAHHLDVLFVAPAGLPERFLRGMLRGLGR